VTVDIADLDRQVRLQSGSVPSDLVERLLELGHVDEVALQAGRGEWCCARAWAGLPAGLRERFGGVEDWEFFGPRLRLMAACGLVEAAIEQARAHPEGGSWSAVTSIAWLLDVAGRTEEAVAVLERHEALLSRELAGLLIGLGRIKDAVAVFQRRVPRPVVEWPGERSDVPPF
jgi:hypothetical protein